MRVSRFPALSGRGLFPALLGLGLLVAGCGSADDDDDSSEDPSATPSADGPYKGFAADTLLVGQSDNAEVIKVLPGTRQAILVSSKARKLTLLEVDGDALQDIRSKTLFDDDPSESELTHVDISSSGAWAVVTRTIIDKNDDGQTIDCRGELVFVDSTDSDSFGTILTQVSVGPMPDAVDISDDDLYVVSANERDVVWGKCEDAADLAPPSISILDVSEGAEQAVEVKRVEMVGDDAREPETLIFSADNDLVGATLQDSHEVIFLRISDVLSLESPTSDAGTIVALPQDSLGRDAWPDGITRFTDGAGKEWFAVAGEANDTLNILDASGQVAASVEITESDVPSSYPRDGSWGPLFQPDSLTSFPWGDVSYVAMSLKSAGAASIWNVDNAAQPELTSVVKVGQDEQASSSEMSTIQPEGISASHIHGFIVTANEGESSATLILPEP